MQGENNKIARYFSVYLSRRGKVHGSFRLSGPDHDYSVHYQTSFRLYFLVGDTTEGIDPGEYMLPGTARARPSVVSLIYSVII